MINHANCGAYLHMKMIKTEEIQQKNISKTKKKHDSEYKDNTNKTRNQINCTEQENRDAIRPWRLC